MFKNKKLIAAAAMIMGFLGIKEIPIADGKVNFEEDQAKSLKEELTEKTFNDLIEAFNKDLAEEDKAKQIKAGIEDLLKETDISNDALVQIVEKAKEEGKDDTLAILQAVQSDLKNTKAIVEKLKNSPEDDTPEDTLKKQAVEMIKHSATHVFGSGKDYDAIDGRPWNAAAIKGVSASHTDYTDSVVINKLNGDAEHFFRENPDVIKSLHRDNFDLPSFWPKRLKVDDKVTSGTILTAEITQGRKFGWLPKNVQEIEAEIGQIYPVQIDAQWSGAQLQEIETMWLNSLMNREGSQPEKWTFVRFLVTELMKRARVEDRISTLNGIFVQTPKTADKAGRFINRQNGVFYQLYKNRDLLKKYRPFNMGEITPENVYDYFHSDDPENLGFLKRLPLDVVAMPNLVVYIHHRVWTWYRAKYKELNGTNQDYKGKPAFFEDYPGIKIETFVDQENPSFVWCTFDDNVEILENIPAEKSAFKFQVMLRDIYMLADYKLGVRIIHIGREVKENDPDEFKVQSVWSNDVPIFPETKYIPVFDNTLGKISVDYKNMAIDDAWNTDITEFTNVKAGQVLKLRGNTAASAKNVKHGAKIALAGSTDFPLNNGGTLTLYVKSDLTVMEISRTTSAPDAPSADVNFTGTTINATSATRFNFTGTSDATLTDIDGGVQDKVIRIYGTDTVDVDFTIEDISGLVVVGADVVLSAATHYLELVLVDGIWYKSAAVTA